MIMIWRSLRPGQWTKNLFVFAGILFSQNIFELSLLVRAVSAFLVFCLLSGTVYIINDLTDLSQDRNHPSKCKRPLASGRLTVSHAIVSSIILACLSLGFSYCLGLSFFLVALTYLLLQLAYSFYLKHIIILDVFAIAFGFMLRVVAGAAVISVEISSWLLICTILLALLLGFGKRRHESVSLGNGAESCRKPQGEYSSHLLDQMISVVTSSTVVAYTLYTISVETTMKFGSKNLIFSIPFVLYGVFRYLYIMHRKSSGGDPANILITDRPLMICVILWMLTVGVVLYL
jgi:4-hydroxybenzoate polyprenyltransferase